MFNEILSLSAVILSALGFIFIIRETRRTRAFIPKVIEQVSESIPTLDDLVFEKEGKWHVDERIGALGDLIGSRVATSLKMTALQALGAEKKLMKGIDKDLGLDIIDNSGIGLILDAFGATRLKNRLGKNPNQALAILSKVAPLLGQGQKNPSSDQGYGEM